MTVESDAVNAATHASPVWAGESFVNAFWIATSETPEWIAARTEALLSQLGADLGITQWDTPKGHHWEAWTGSGAALADIVRNRPVREALPDGASGDALPREGFSIVLVGVGPTITAKISIAAGSIGLGMRLPRHNLHIDLTETAPGGVSSGTGDKVCAAVASTWQPATLTLTDLATIRLARRNNWKIGAGYRTWISKEVGEVNHLVDLLTATELAGGTLISAPDDWPAERVVEAMTATLRENGLDEVPH
ncbi:hypothetical protein [Mycobacteroides abscessus]|uniref:hypothetical protein n=1 Tax=Mycobacteroides abscessus TaxID=36809 RepID=UPI0009261986|nr:hypothetical protein [Mycobacteroides abscessus]SIB68257.1 Uncharacterised protein [Mycobacteroides abscessus subsp. bolletii]SKT71665.1 Uncharacterised protein [Mycobacteroides abscessus subsp. bolletii]